MLLDPTCAAAATYTAHPVPRDLIPSSGNKKAQILWVGCSDSWITETQTLDVMAEETFVHRNLGNVISNGDLSSESAIAWALEGLKVNHIVVCGHYDCGLLRVESEEPNGIHSWYKDLSTLRAANDSFLTSVDPVTRDHHLVEVYVLAEVNWLKTHPVVKKAIEERGLKVHAFVFDKEKEATVQLIEGDRPESKETEIKSPMRNGAGKVAEGETKCDGACGGKGMCKKAEENEEKYAF